MSKKKVLNPLTNRQVTVDGPVVANMLSLPNELLEKILLKVKPDQIASWCAIHEIFADTCHSKSFKNAYGKKWGQKIRYGEPGARGVHTSTFIVDRSKNRRLW